MSYALTMRENVVQLGFCEKKLNSTKVIFLDSNELYTKIHFVVFTRATLC